MFNNDNSYVHNFTSFVPTFTWIAKPIRSPSLMSLVSEKRSISGRSSQVFRYSRTYEICWQGRSKGSWPLRCNRDVSVFLCSSDKGRSTSITTTEEVTWK